MQDLEFRQFIERVKLRTPVETVVGDRVTGLRQRGSLFWACCPFHQEKTASFAVDTRRGTWRCFGACGEGGDVLSFVERFDGLSFLDALRLLAQQCGEDLPERSLRRVTNGGEVALQARYDLMEWAFEAYRSAWEGSEATPARTYMQGRGLSDATLGAFGMGWAPASGQFLVGLAQRQNKPLDGLAEVGLVRRSESGRYYDFFRGRALLPIRDRLRRVVGFGGRLVESSHAEEAVGERGPKYINTPETPLFHKGRLIFGLDLSMAQVRSSRQLLVVEGYTDVMAAHQAGYANAVAVLGTATTEDHAGLIRRSGARSVVLAFDGDEAGRRAGLRALAGLLKLPLELRVAALPEGHDPGDLLVTEEGIEVFRAHIEGAREWFDWCLLGLKGLRGRELTDAVEECFQLLAKVERPLERSSRLGEMATFLGLPEVDVRAQWDDFQRTLGRAARPAPKPLVPTPSRRPRRAQGPSQERAYGLLVGALLQDNSLVPLYSHLAETCPEGDLSVLFHQLLEIYERDESGAPIDASALMTALGDHPARARAVELQARAEEAESSASLASDQARWIQRATAEREIESLKSALSAAPESEQEQALARLHEELRAARVPSQNPASVRSP